MRTVGVGAGKPDKKNLADAKLKKELKELKAENERLKEVIADQNELCWNCKKSVKEFAEKLKKIVFEQGNPYNVPYEEFSQANVLFMVIDELLKEYEK